ncbi:MAG: hypothetical protein R6V45_02535, partial [Oceanipulchritudo sp.]
MLETIVSPSSRHPLRTFFGALSLALLIPLQGMAEAPPESGGESSPDGEASSAEAQFDPPEIVETHHSIEIDGTLLAYTARAGKLILKDETGEPTAGVFFVAYTMDESSPDERPLTFSFNGGPGSSSVWMH